MNNIDDLYIAEQGRKLSQFIAEQIDRGIREALGADTASLIENQAARIAELEADRDRLAVIVERFVSISVSEDHEFQDVEKEKEID